MRLHLQPCSLMEANEFVEKFHRHHPKVIGHKFSIAASNGEKIVAVAIIGRPVSRILDNGLTLEVNRLCSDGSKNACSFLYAAAWRATRALGFRRLITYTLKSEGGSSLRAAGWKLLGERTGKSWTCPSRPRIDKHSLQDKFAWEAA